MKMTVDLRTEEEKGAGPVNIELLMTKTSGC